ncbi:hypothetical protein D7X25_16450 [bacterium 1XD42-8]|nr:hypothetical protein D7X25_16450 [bacterium 1XD42-8]
MRKDHFWHIKIHFIIPCIVHLMIAFMISFCLIQNNNTPKMQIIIKEIINFCKADFRPFHFHYFRNIISFFFDESAH